MRLLLSLVAAIALFWSAPPALAQEATLVADSVSISADQTLIATGNVEVFYQGTRLRAAAISFDRATGKLLITGPLYIVDGTELILIADSADLDADLRNGILRGARMVLNQQLQLAASQINRVGGRYTQLSKVVASSCQVCAASPVPLWEIRARRVVHDQQERQLYFDNATFRIAGVPVAYIPRLRMPDPTLNRATGFMMPTIRTTSQLGTGIKVPYFITLGDSRDLMLTPYFSTNTTRTVELRYRQALRTGALLFNGALTSDTLLAGETRGYLFGGGTVGLANGFVLNFNLQTTSDPAYLLDYGYSSIDRLESNIELTRTRRNEYISAQLFHFHSIREGESNATLPSLVGELTYHRRFGGNILGGEGGFRFQTYSLHRTSDADRIGRDTQRASARVDYRRNFILPAGITASAQAEITGDIYNVSQDAAFPGTIARFTPVGAVELRWPWVKVTPRGVSHLIEPVVQVIYSPTDGEVPNEDSTLVEFDEGNLFALNRFPGSDVTERGLRANVGMAWTRFDPAGWSLGVTVGRVFRAEDLAQFSAGTGLSGKTSDWLAAVQLITADGLALTNRAVFDDQFDFAKNELRLAYASDRVLLGTSYIWLVADNAEDRPSNTAEWLMDASYKFRTDWTGSASWRYDVDAGQATNAGLGLRYLNDCVAVDLSLSRRFTSSTSVEPTTDFGLSVELIGFGSGAAPGAPRASCRK